MRFPCVSTKRRWAGPANAFAGRGVSRYGAPAVRTVLYRLDDARSFLAMLRDADLELPLPAPPPSSPEGPRDGEWVLVAFEVEGLGETSIPARTIDLGDDDGVLAFEPRDWERLVAFAEGRPPASVPPPFASKPSLGSFRAATRFASGDHAHARVLLVDDDDDIRDVVGAMLEAAEAALDRLEEEAFDMAVLDWSLPGKTGLDLCRQIRADEGLAALPILFLTAHSASQDVVEAFASGADDYVVKPFRAPELGARIFSLLRRARGVGARA